MAQAKKHPEALLLVVAILLYFALDYFIDLPPTGLEFYSEVVKAEPRGDYLTIDGEYHFRANHPRKRAYELGYPTIEKSGEPPPREVEVTVNGQPFAVEVLPEGLRYTLPVEPGKEILVTTRYTVPAPDKQGTYITRTANLWPKPITSARFIIPATATSNYHQPGATEVEFLKFRPKDNWRIQWK